MPNATLAKNIFSGLMLFVALYLSSAGCSVRTRPSVFEDRLLSYSVAAQSQNVAALNSLLLKLNADLEDSSTRRDVKLFVLRSEVRKQLALLNFLAGSGDAQTEINRNLIASLRDAGIALQLAERIDTSADWIKPAVYNNVGDLLSIKGMLLDKNMRAATFGSADQKREAFAEAAMLHLAALAFHLQSKLLSNDLVKSSKDPSVGLKLEVSKSDERIAETLSRAINDLSEVLSPARRNEIIKQAEEGKALYFLTNFSLSAQTHTLTGFLLSEKVTPFIEKRDVNGCLTLSGQSARHYAVGAFFSEGVDESFRVSVIAFVTCPKLDGGS